MDEREELTLCNFMYHCVGSVVLDVVTIVGWRFSRTRNRNSHRSLDVTFFSQVLNVGGEQALVRGACGLFSSPPIPLLLTYPPVASRLRIHRRSRLDCELQLRLSGPLRRRLRDYKPGPIGSLVEWLIG